MKKMTALITHEDIQKLRPLLAFYTKLTIVKDRRKVRVKFILCAGKDKIERTFGIRSRQDIAFVDCLRIAKDLEKELINTNVTLTNVDSDIYSIEIKTHKG